MADVVRIAEDFAPRFFHGSVEVGVSVVQVIDKPLVILKGIQLKADAANAGFVHIGNSSVTTGTGFQLDAGESIFLPLEDITKVFAIADQASQVLYWLAL